MFKKFIPDDFERVFELLAFLGFEVGHCIELGNKWFQEETRREGELLLMMEEVDVRGYLSRQV